MKQVNVVIVYLPYVQNSFQIINIPDISAHLESTRQMNVVIVYLLFACVQTSFQIIYIADLFAHLESMKRVNVLIVISYMCTKQLLDYIYNRYTYLLTSKV